MFIIIIYSYSLQESLYEITVNYKVLLLSCIFYANIHIKKYFTIFVFLVTKSINSGIWTEANEATGEPVVKLKCIAFLKFPLFGSPLVL